MLRSNLDDLLPFRITKPEVNFPFAVFRHFFTKTASLQQRWKVLQHAIPHHWCDEPTIHGPKFTITEASHRSACLVVVTPPNGLRWKVEMKVTWQSIHKDLGFVLRIRDFPFLILFWSGFLGYDSWFLAKHVHNHDLELLASIWYLLGGSSQDLDTRVIMTMVTILSPLRIGLWDPFQMAYLNGL